MKLKTKPILPSSSGKARISSSQTGALALQPSQRKHAVLLERAGELLGGDAVDLVSAVGHEVEDEAHLADFLWEGPHLVVLMPVVSQLNEGERL